MIRVGYAAGAFDLFHVGHLNLLRRAKSQCDYLIAGVVSDEMLKLTKGITPVVSLRERLEIVRDISFVDRAVAEILPAKIDTWRELRFHVFFKGDDWKGTEKGDRVERDFAAVGVERFGPPFETSTTSRSGVVIRTASAQQKRSSKKDDMYVDIAKSEVASCESEDQVWVQDQTARIFHRYVLFGRHCRLDVNALLSRVARARNAVEESDNVVVGHQAA